MAQTLITSDVITKRSLADFQNKLVWGGQCYKGWEPEFANNEYQKGDTVNVRLPVQYRGDEGRSLSIQDTIETSTPFQIQYQPGVRIGNFSSKNLTLDIGEFDRRYTQQVGSAIANKIDALISDETLNASNFYIMPSISSSSVNGLRAFMNKLAIPTDMRYLNLAFDYSSELADSLNNNFSNKSREEALYDGYIVSSSQFDITECTHIKYHESGIGAGGAATNGLIDAGTVSVAVASGNQIDITGVAADTTVFKAGDVIEISAIGLSRINPKSYEVNFLNPQFVITEDAISTGTDVTITVSPAIVSDSTSPYQNINIEIPIGAEVKLAASHLINMGWHEMGLACVSPQLVMPMDSGSNASRMPDPDTGWSLRVSYEYTQGEDQNSLRADTLLGVKIFPQYCVRTIILS